MAISSIYVIGFLFGGSHDRTKDVEKAIQEARGKIHLGGLRGESLRAFLRAAITNLHFKWIQKKERNIGNSLENFKKDIEKHLVLDAENDEIKAVKNIVKDYTYLYLTLHSLLLFEKYDLEQFEKFVEKLTNFAEKKKLDKEAVRNCVNVLTESANMWKNDIEQLRKMINSVFERAEGKSGWALTMFEKMHKEGFFIRYQERKHFKEAIHDEKTFEKAMKKVSGGGQIKNLDELKNLMNSIKDKEKEMAYDFLIVYKMLFETWDSITKQMITLLGLTEAAAKQHEIPTKDYEKMVNLHNLIVKNLDEDYLHALRIDDKQLEGTYSEVMARIERLKKLA